MIAVVFLCIFFTFICLLIVADLIVSSELFDFPDERGEGSVRP